MSVEPLELVRQRLEERGSNPGRGERFMARCVAHDDRTPSLSVSLGDDGQVLLHCFAGCPAFEIVEALGLGWRDLYPGDSADNGRGTEIAVYRYVDEQGVPLFEVVRKHDENGKKVLPTRRPDGTWRIEGVRRVLYRLPKVIDAITNGTPVTIVEGERDVHSLEARGEVATTCPGGAGKWRAEYNAVFRGANVTIIRDIDKPDKSGRLPGQEHAQQVAEQLAPVAASVKVFEPATGKDVSDHLAAGLGLEALVAVEGEPVVSEEQPFALPLDEFLAAKSEAPSVLVGNKDANLLPAGGLAILFAKGGRGKTTLTTDGAFHLASGVDWLGFEVPRALRVLIIENEGPREPFREKLEAKRKLWEHEITGGIYVYTEDWGSLVLSADSILRLRRFVEENEIDIVFGDPLDSLGIKGVGSPEDTREFCKLLVAAGLTRDLAFWLLHHPRKADSEDELDEVSGAWGGRVDSLMKLDKLDGNRARLGFPKVRWSRRGDLPALILAFEPDSEGFTVVGEEAEEDRDLLPEIEALLADGKWRTVAEVAAPKDPKEPEPGKQPEEPGIGANSDAVKALLNGRPDRFEMRTGESAQALGRSFKAKLYQLTRGSEEVESVSDSLWTEEATDSTHSTLYRSESRLSQSIAPSATDSDPESEPLDPDAKLRRIEEKFGPLHESQRGEDSA